MSNPASYQPTYGGIPPGPRPCVTVEDWRQPHIQDATDPFLSTKLHPGWLPWSQKAGMHVGKRSGGTACTACAVPCSINRTWPSPTVPLSFTVTTTYADCVICIGT